MLPTVFGENLFDDFFADPFENGFDRSFFGGQNALYGKHAKNLMKTDVRMWMAIMSCPLICPA